MSLDEYDKVAETAPGPDARISAPLALGLGAQLAALVLPGAVLMPTIVFRSAGQPEDVLLWAVFASVVVSGGATALQAVRAGRLGAGYLIATGASAAAIAISIAALDAGGPALLAVLVLAMAVLQFPEFFAALTGGTPLNGMMAGGIVAIVATLFTELTKPRSQKVEVAFDRSALGEIREFTAAFAARSGWDEAMAARLDAVSEETLLTLLAGDEAAADAAPGRLLVVARREDGGATLEFVASRGQENLQDRIALLSETSADDVLEREVSLRLLRHLASSVRHQQYYDTDVVTVRVEAGGR